MVKAIGISTPPAKPCRPRIAIIEPRSCAKAQAIENSAKQNVLRDHVAAEREHPAQIGGERDHHDLADQVGGRDPGAVVDAGADAALDVEQRGIGDLDVEDRHEGADHAGERRRSRSSGSPCRRLQRRSARHWPPCLHDASAMAAGSTRKICRLITGPLRRAPLSRAAWCRWSDRPTCPGADRRRAGSPASSTIFTGMRCTTLVKLPVALSGGSSANSCPLAGAMLSTWPVDRDAREHVDFDLDRLAGPHVGELRLLVVGDDIGGGDRHDRHQLRACLHILADAQRAVADDAVDRRDDRRVGEVQLGLVAARPRRGRAVACACASSAFSTSTCLAAVASAAVSRATAARAAAIREAACWAFCTLP